MPFSLSRAKNANGDEILTYTALVENLPVSITYSIPADTVESYVVHVNGRVEGIRGRITWYRARKLQPKSRPVR